MFVLHPCPQVIRRSCNTASAAATPWTLPVCLACSIDLLMHPCRLGGRSGALHARASTSPVQCAAAHALNDGRKHTGRALNGGQPVARAHTRGLEGKSQWAHRFKWTRVRPWTTRPTCLDAQEELERSRGVGHADEEVASEASSLGLLPSRKTRRVGTIQERRISRGEESSTGRRKRREAHAEAWKHTHTHMHTHKRTSPEALGAPGQA